MDGIEWLLTHYRCWSALFWFAFVNAGVKAVVVAFATGLIIARQKRAFWPTLAVPLGIVAYMLGIAGIYAKGPMLHFGFTRIVGLRFP